MPRYDLDSLENRDPALIQRLHRWLARPLRRYFRAEVRGVGRVPSGAALLVGNHSGGLLSADTLLLGFALYEAHGLAGLPYGLGHDLSLGLSRRLLAPLGGVRASHMNAARLFARGDKVLVYPGGDVEALRPYRHRDRVVFDGRRGYVRLALREGVPLVPVVAAGSHGALIVLDDLRPLARWLGLERLRVKVWPLTLSVPWGLTLGPPPVYLPLPVRVLIEVLPAIRFERRGEEAATDEAYVAACAARVEGTLQETLTRLAGELRGKPPGPRP